MKPNSIISAVVFLIASAAFAHPTDSDTVMQIPLGAKFLAKTEINIKPNTTRLYMQNGRIVTDYKDVRDAEPACDLGYDSSANDRIMKVGRALTFRKITFAGRLSDSFTDLELMGRTIWVFRFSESKVALVCYTAKAADKPSLTIGQMKEAIHGIIELQYPTPIEF
jgi:hypothetical protein